MFSLNGFICCLSENEWIYETVVIFGLPYKNAIRESGRIKWEK